MSLLLVSKRWVLATLSALVLLPSSPARADLPSETIYLSRAEISDEALRGVIGIAFIRSMTGSDQLPSGEIPCFLPDGDAFEPDGTLVLKDLRAISGWDYDLQSLRKFPVVARRGHHLQVVIDARTNERAWISEIQEDDEGPEVDFLPFDAKQFEWSGIELYHLAPKGQSRLYVAPRPDARFHSLSPDYPPRWNGEFVEVRIVKARGNFMLLGALVNLDTPLEPLGWVPITDENGLLLVWPMYAAMC
ncbi:hypothetical protein [Hyalangium sp.]|uniref:hypothetical protein n=1 Tax=Hyalangium sp. TaxID=2028555 RepID=UPI002D6A1349|nr:hypothetical protein [Hyalangium sp.]HYI02517.1 hypothetical protein [Hyalangium sp.]